MSKEAKIAVAFAVAGLAMALVSIGLQISGYLNKPLGLGLAIIGAADVMSAEKSRGKSRRPRDIDLKREEEKIEQTYLEVLMECDGEDELRALLTSLGLKRGTERFRDAIAAWREIQSKDD